MGRGSHYGRRRAVAKRAADRERRVGTRLDTTAVQALMADTLEAAHARAYLEQADPAASRQVKLAMLEVATQ